VVAVRILMPAKEGPTTPSEASHLEVVALVLLFPPSIFALAPASPKSLTVFV
jgi:hypothetical protein